MRTYAYIDGFNLYYGAVKGTPYKWLDLKALVERIFPRNQIARVRYFTARVQPPPWDPGKPQRQDAYLRALRAYRADFDIYKGYFLEKPVEMPRADGTGMVKVLKTEEKGSDVNLAVHLLNDAWKGLFEAAIVVSNDSDLVEAIRLVKEEHGLPVGILNPQIDPKKRTAIQLNRVASFRGRISIADLRACQLPSPIPGTNLYKPPDW